MKKVLVLGAGGMAGHVVATTLKKSGFKVSTLSLNFPLDDETIILDVTDRLKFEEVLNKGKYEIVVNCIGVLVKKSEERKDLAVYLNSFLPHYLEKFYADSSTKVIHLSTDCVFSGQKSPYKEDSDYDGKTFYDRSKALGEIINSKDLTFRMSIIGPDMQKEGLGLFNWFFQQKGEISGYTHSIWSGITTIELAKGIVSAIEQDLTGLYHLVPNENISKYDLLCLMQKIFNKNDVKIVPTPGLIVDKTLVNTRNDFEFKVLDYESMIKEMKDWINLQQPLYRHYG